MRQNYPYESSPAARHYHPTLSIWLSVDPMSDKYPGNVSVHVLWKQSGTVGGP